MVIVVQQGWNYGLHLRVTDNISDIFHLLKKRMFEQLIHRNTWQQCYVWSVTMTILECYHDNCELHCMCRVLP